MFSGCLEMFSEKQQKILVRFLYRIILLSELRSITLAIPLPLVRKNALKFSADGPFSSKLLSHRKKVACSTGKENPSRCAKYDLLIFTAFDVFRRLLCCCAKIQLSCQVFLRFEVRCRWGVFHRERDWFVKRKQKKNKETRLVMEPDRGKRNIGDCCWSISVSCQGSREGTLLGLNLSRVSFAISQFQCFRVCTPSGGQDSRKMG